MLMSAATILLSAWYDTAMFWEAGEGSVVPFFLKKKSEGILPITHPQMTRFWITPDQGAKFVLKGLEILAGGEIFVPKIPSMNMVDLARAICPECKTEIVGIRPGEKLHEVMVPKGDARRTLEYEDYYLIQPDFNFWGRRFKGENGKPISDDFEYSSDTNPWKLSIEEAREMIRGLEHGDRDKEKKRLD